MKPNSHLKIIINYLSLSMKQGPMMVLGTLATKICDRRFNVYCVAFEYRIGLFPEKIIIFVKLVFAICR